MTIIQNRQDTAANWYNVNPILAVGEIGFETDTNKFKIGDGVTSWRDLAYPMPTKTSQLTNDSGFINLAQIPTKTSQLQNDSGFLTEHQDISGKADKATTLAGYGITNAYTKAEIDGRLSGAMKYKGTVQTPSDLPVNPEIGDTYNVNDTGANYAWNGTNWDKLSENIDLSDYARLEDVPTMLSDLTNDTGFITVSALNGYALSSEIPTATSDLINDSGFVNSSVLSGYATKSDLNDKQDKITDLTDIRNGANAGTTALQSLSDYQPLLVSGTNIKTINNQSLLGSGNIAIEGGGGAVDQTYDATSANAQSGVAINGARFLRNNVTNSYALSILGEQNSNIYCISLGIDSNAKNYGIGIGYKAIANGNYAIQLGRGTNSTANTLSVGLSSSTNYQLLDSSGIIPDARLSNNIARTSSIGNGTITFTQGGVTKGTITTNQSGDATIDFDAGGGGGAVDSVNGYTGTVVLTASDVGAVDLTSAQDISGKKTFLGEKAIYFKQQTTSNKLGFTLYDPSNVELGALEYRPNTINGASLLALNCPQTTGGYVGFRYWGSPAVNIVAPKVATAGNYFIPTHITNGNTTVTASNTGTVNISTLLPDISIKQDTLVSGTNIKTINNESLLGSGNITIQGGSGVSMTYDSTTETLIFA